MAVTNYKVTFFFEGVQPAGTYASSIVGWTETWYFALDGSLDAMLTNVEVDNYIAARRAFMPSIYRVVWVRASDTADPRSSKTKAILNGWGVYSGPPALLYGIVGNPGGGGRPVQTPTLNPTIKPAQVNCAVLVNFTRLGQAAGPPPEPAHQRRFLIRGLPDDIMIGNILDPTSASFAAMRAFCNYVGNHETGTPPRLVQSPWLMRYITPANQVTYPITNLAPVAGVNGQLTLTAANLPALTQVNPNLNRVQVKGVSSLTPANRIWNVIGTSNIGGPAILGTSRKAIIGTASTQGTARVMAFSYNYANEYLIVGMRDKHTGRPFRLTRGRRRVL